MRALAELFLSERNRWFLWLPVGVGAGIVGYFALPFEPSLYCLAATPVLIVALGLTLLRAYSLAVAMLAIMLCFAAGFNAAQIETWVAATPMLNRELPPISVDGLLMQTETMPDGARLTLKYLQRADNGKNAGRADDPLPTLVRVKVKTSVAELPPTGSWVNLLVELRPFSDPVAPSAYDFRRQAFFRGYGATGWSYGKITLATSPLPQLSTWDNLSLKLEEARRSLAVSAYTRLSGDTAAITAALLNGEQSGISETVLQDMRASGISHLLSISGIHVSMMGALVYFPIRALLALIPWIALRFSIKKWAAVAAIAATIGYSMLIGPQTPTIRSAMMTGIIMLAIIVDRRALSMRLVAVSAAIVMLFYPDGMLGPSFQMSFAAVLAMVAAFEKPMDRALAEGNLSTATTASLGSSWSGRVFKGLWGIVLTSLVATAATTPFTLYHFQNFSFYGLIANMIAVPLTSFWVMPCLLMTYITAPFGLEGWFVTAAGWGVDLIIKLAQVVASWPQALLYLPAMPLGLLVITAGGGLWLCLWQRWWRYLGIVPIIIGLLYPLYTNHPDVFIAEDGLQWAAVLPDGRMAVSGDDYDKFVPRQWRQRLGTPETVDLKDYSVEHIAVATNTDRLLCDTGGCVFRRYGHTIALPATAEAAWEDCTRAEAVLSGFKLRECGAEMVVDYAALYQHGAHSLLLPSDPDQSITVRFARTERGLRPWSVGYGESHAKQVGE